jgi:hypothetical protein
VRRVGYCNRLAEPPPITQVYCVAAANTLYAYETPKIRNPGCFVYLPKLLLSELLSELFLAAAVTDIGTHGCKKAANEAV